MRLEDQILISVDDHVVEPPGMSAFYREHVPAAYKDRVPKVVRRSDGTDAWVVEGVEISTFGLNAVQGRPRADWGRDPHNFDEVRPSCFDVHERVRDMNANGVLASMNFSSWPGLGGQFFAQQNSDADYVKVMIRAYNDWHLNEWCGAYPGRFIPLALSGFVAGPEFIAEEVRRMAELGVRAVSMHPEPYRFGAPDYHGDEWDVAWRACEETGTVAVFHFGAYPRFMPRSPFSVIPHSMPFSTAIFAAELLWSPVMRKFPDLKFSLAEGGIGWLPFFLEKADFVYKHHNEWTGEEFGDELPSEVFRRAVLGCFIDDVTGLRNRDVIGKDRIAWECDFPHSDSTWPEGPEVAQAGWEAAGMPDEDIDLASWKNAADWFGFDPFEHRSREECTVGALRALATDVDTRPVDYGDHRVEAKAVAAGAGRFVETLYDNDEDATP